MFVNVRGKFAEFALSVLVLFTQICPSTVEDAEKPVRMWVHNATIDIAILYDQSDSMRRYLNHTIWTDMQVWVENYFKGTGANETRFAIMGCKGKKDDESVDPALFFDGTTSSNFATKPGDYVQTILDAQDYVRLKEFTGGSSDNVDGCARSAVEKIFQTSKGDRPGAGNVVLYVSDCCLFGNGNIEKQIAALLSQSKAFLFICTQSRQELCLRDDYFWKSMMQWVKNESLIYSFTTREELVKRLDEVLEGTWIDVRHCKTSAWKLSGCVTHEGKCVVMNYTIVEQHPDPPQYGMPCPKNATVRECDQKECDVTTKDTDKKGSTDSDGSPTTGIIIGAVVGLVVLMILIHLLFVLSRKRKSPEKKAEGVGVQDRHGKVEEKGVKVDLEARTSTNIGKRGKSTMSKPKEGKAKTDGGKSPTMTKSISKRAKK